MDATTHSLFRRVPRQRVGETRVLGGTVTEVSADGSLVRVESVPGVEGAWVPADGVTAVGGAASVTVGTDGRPIASAALGDVPPGAEPVFVGPTGFKISQAVQRIDSAHDRLVELDDALASAREFFVTSLEEPTEADGAHRPLGTIWHQVEDTWSDPLSVMGRWVLTEDGWEVLDDTSVLHAGTVSAAVAVFIDAIMQNLTVTGAANISEAAIGELTARVAEIIKVRAEQVIVGKDIRFWSGGLVFYAPAAEGQDPEDWESRIPIIAIMPTGDVSVGVAQDGVVTAGLAPDGSVHGRVGRFDGLQVGGRTLAQHLAVFPRGILGVSRVGNNMNITTTSRIFLGVRTQLSRGRMYRFRYNIGLSRSSGEIKVRTILQTPGASRTIATADHGFNGDFTSSATFSSDEYPFAEGDTCAVLVELQCSASGATGTMWANTINTAGGSYVTLEDCGPAVAIWTETSGGEAPPAQTTRTIEITSVHAVGIRSNGSAAPDSRLTLNGESMYGPDMAQMIYYQTQLAQLDGATINKAELIVTVQQSGSSGAGTAFYIDASYGGSRLGLTSTTLLPTGQQAIGIPASTMQRIVGAWGFMLVPFYPGSINSYGYMAPSVTLRVTYTK